jgi:hypothetical protein
MGKEYIDGMTEAIIEEVGKKMLFMGLGNMYGKMEEAIKDIGS